MFSSYSTKQPNHRANSSNAPNAAQIKAAIATLQALTKAAGPAAKPKPTNGYNGTPKPSHQAHLSAVNWKRVERCNVYLTDPRLCPVTLPLRPQKGLTALASGNPAKRFSADGFVGRDGKPVACLVVPHFEHGTPMVIWADGAPIASFKVQE